MRESTFFQGLPFQILCAAIAAVVLAMIGPYGTYTELPLDRRLAYWALSVTAGWSLMLGITALVDRVEPLQGWPVAGRMVLAGLAGGIPMTGVVWLIEAAFRRVLPVAALPEAFMNTEVLTVVMAVAIGQIVELRLRVRAGEADLLRARPGGDLQAPASPPPSPGPSPSPAVEPAPPAAPAPSPAGGFLRRLPAALGRDLLALEMEDHYVRVHTALGSTLILLRLRDAVTELGEGSGLQVHRSWWVARDAVVDVRRGDGRAVLTLKDGAKIPVSRAYARTLRAAGWF
jgi:hypothetical protein